MISQLLKNKLKRCLGFLKKDSKKSSWTNDEFHKVFFKNAMNRLFFDRPTSALESFQDAVDKEIAKHHAAGRSVPRWQDGEVVHIWPDG
jgi:hypothetical protein